jgi:hypothetical protein
MRNAYKDLDNLKGKDHLGDLRVNDRIILKQRPQPRKICPGFESL